MHARVALPAALVLVLMSALVLPAVSGAKCDAQGNCVKMSKTQARARMSLDGLRKLLLGLPLPPLDDLEDVIMSSPKMTLERAIYQLSRDAQEVPDYWLPTFAQQATEKMAHRLSAAYHLRLAQLGEEYESVQLSNSVYLRTKAEDDVDSESKAATPKRQKKPAKKTRPPQEPRQTQMDRRAKERNAEAQFSPETKLYNNPDVQVTTQYPGPRTFFVENFVTDEEADYILELLEAKIDQFHDTGETGISYEMPVNSDPLLRNMSARQYELLGMPASENQDTLTFRMRRYVADRYHPLHTDTYYYDGLSLVATLMVYLTDVEEGGETFFPRAFDDRADYEDTYHSIPDIDYYSDLDPKKNLVVKPKKGGMFVWLSCDPQGRDDPLSLHGSRPVIKGVKWTATHFMYQPTKLCAMNLQPPYDAQFQTPEAIEAAANAQRKAFSKDFAPLGDATLEELTDLPLDTDLTDGDLDELNSALSRDKLRADGMSDEDIDELLEQIRGLDLDKYGGASGREHTDEQIAENMRKAPCYGNVGKHETEYGTVEVLSAYPGPRVWMVDDFLNATEVEYVLNLAKSREHRFMDTQETGISHELPISSDALVSEIAERQYALLGTEIDPSMADHTWRLRKYQHDQYHPIHTDTYAFSDNSYLIATMLIYLTDVEDGGDTFFPRVGEDREQLKPGEFFDFDGRDDSLFTADVLTVKPKAGRLIVWLSCDVEGNDDKLSIHGSRPIKSGTKWTATNFIYQNRKYCALHGACK